MLPSSALTFTWISWHLEQKGEVSSLTAQPLSLPTKARLEKNGKQNTVSPWAAVSPPFSKLTGYSFKDFKGQFDRMRSLLYQLT